MEKEKNAKGLLRRALWTMLFMLFSVGVYAQDITVRGSVVDQNGEPVIGASVKAAGTKVGTVTNMDGNYMIKCDRNATLEISSLGFESQTIKVNGQNTLNVVLNDQSKNLNEVVVTAMGIKKDQKKLGYAVSTVNAEDLVKTGAPNFATALYGKASGVRISAAPGGNVSAVAINVRGFSSITGTTQPLIVLDGMPIHNGETNNEGYWSNQRIRSNGLVDINPEDIENISILKGASASALYGSEAANGVVMITTKSGHAGNQGIGVDFNASLAVEDVAYMPEIQKEFGPGYGSLYWFSDYAWESGGFHQRVNRNTGETVRALLGTNYNWGPKYDGQDVYYWDGTTRKYSPISGDPWKEVFRTGFDQNYNVAMTNGGKWGNIRFSYTYTDVTPTQYNSYNNKHNFNLTGQYNVAKGFKIDYSANYMRQRVKNRPYRMYRLTANYGGMFGGFEDIKYLREHTLTSLGYMMQMSQNGNSETPDENLAYGPGCSALVSEYFWNIFGKVQMERNNRFLGSVRPSWQITDWLTLSGRIGTDLTTNATESKQRNERSLAFQNGGYYGLANDRYEIYYGDIMLTFDKYLTEKFNLQAMAGWQGRQEKNLSTSVGTNNGLSIENWFHLQASNDKANASMTKQEFLKTAWFGTLTLGWDNWAYLEASGRQDKTSTLKHGSNTFFYPSFNASAIVSEMLKDSKPRWFDYGKVRLSYGIVGNYPAIYRANLAYTQNSWGGYIYNIIDGSLGNDNIKPEKKYEFEVGLEGKFFQNRLGFEFSYYTNKVKDQILDTTLPASSGGTSILMNVGELSNKGVEFSMYATPIQTKDWTWDVSFNISHNKNKVTKLADGLDVLKHFDSDGAIRLVSRVGEPMGDWEVYAHKHVYQMNDGSIMQTGNDLDKALENGASISKDLGVLVDDNGLPVADKRDMVKCGNAMPKVVGGLGTSLTWKDLRLDIMTDFRIGGSIWNQPYQYMMDAGNTTSSLEGREGHGGLPYYYAGDDYNNQNPTAGMAPNGEKQFYDGIIFDGVDAQGNPNTQIQPAGIVYDETYGWGSGTYQTYAKSVQKNNYWKLREVSLAYTLPQSISRKFACQRLQISVFGRNLLYFHKSLKEWDAETADGMNWIYQSIVGGSTATTRSFGVSLRASF